jgi:recombination protein RecR
LSNLAPPLERVIQELCKLPSIGRKSAQRLAFHLLKASGDEVSALAQSLLDLHGQIRFCRDCFNFSDQDLCPICSDPRRDRTLLCIVEEATNLVALERSSVFKGLYHVIGGAISPLKNIGPDQLHLRELMERMQKEEFKEIILATNPNVEGEATAVYLTRLLKPLGMRVTRLAQGLPAGGDLEYTDDLTLQRAMEGRRDY